MGICGGRDVCACICLMPVCWDTSLPSRGPIPLDLPPLPPQGQRTVYRLTLVKEWNTEELDAYAELVGVGKPDFIEVKVSEWQCCPSCLAPCRHHKSNLSYVPPHALCMAAWRLLTALSVHIQKVQRFLVLIAHCTVDNHIFHCWECKVSFDFLQL